MKRLGGSMKTLRKTHVEFSLYVKGRILRDFKIIKVQSRDISKVEIPKNAFGYRFFDVVSNFSDEGVWLGSDRVNFTPFYYFGGTLYTIAQAKKAFSEIEKTLESMRLDGVKKIIRFKTGMWQMFRQNDLIIKRPRTKKVYKAPNKKL